MLSPTLYETIQHVHTLTYKEQWTLLEYLTTALRPVEAPSRSVIKLGGVFGSLSPSASSDPIADALDELTQERANHFDKEWS